MNTNQQSNRSQIAAPKPALEPIRGQILIVEDEMSLRTAINHILYSIDPGFAPVWVESAEKALKLLEHVRFDLIVSDHYLAGPRSGLDLWSICHRRFSKIPFLLVSGMGVETYVKLTRGLPHPPPYLPKPFSIETCRDTVSALLGVKERNRYVS